jgi:cell pole-organizing protein PopZ
MGTFGEMLGAPADDLVRIVRQDRLARQAVQTQQIPTFGDVAAETRNVQAQQQAAAAAASPEVQAQQVANVASSIRFLVDTKTGEFEPVMPEQPDPAVGPSEILFTVNPQDPTQPNIVAQGKRVTPADLARLGNAEKGIQPALRKGYQVPEQYAAIAQALGIG